MSLVIVVIRFDHKYGHTIDWFFHGANFHIKIFNFRFIYENIFTMKNHNLWYRP